MKERRQTETSYISLLKLAVIQKCNTCASMHIAWCAWRRVRLDRVEMEEKDVQTSFHLTATIVLMIANMYMCLDGQ
jgi:hypothetical protein